MNVAYLPLGGAREVGASCGVLTIGDTHLLIDAGLRHSASAGARMPDVGQIPAPPAAILITHAHIDHTGALPLVASLYPDVPIFATESTIALMRVLLVDSVRVMEAESLRPEGETPLYDHLQVEALLARITPVSFDQLFQPVAAEPAITARFLRSGHILGAGMLVVDSPAGRVLHTGDFSVTDQRTIKGVDLQNLPDSVDLMICEGTYGNRMHNARRDEERRLVELVQRVVGAGGRMLFPAFGVGRAQEIVLILKAFRANGEIPPVPIYIDGMCRAVCDTYQAQAHDLHPKLQNHLHNSRRPLFADLSLRVFAVRQQDRSALLERHKAAIIVSSSGMLSGGPSPLYARAMAAYAQDAICFTGYQDEESPGAALLRVQQGGTVKLDGVPIQLGCQIQRYNLSAHADAGQIEHVIAKVRPRQVALVHGMPEALEPLKDRLRGYNVMIPSCGEAIALRTERRRSQPGLLDGAGAELPAADAIPIDPPTPATLYAAVQAIGAAPRPWTAVEIGQCYYGPDYRPVYRPIVEQALVGAADYFRIQRLGVQNTYIPRPVNDVVHRTTRATEVQDLQPGTIILTQGSNRQGAAHLAILTEPLQDNTVQIIAEGWKGRSHPISVIQIVPGIERPDLLVGDPADVKLQLRQWREQIVKERVDLITLWDAHSDQPRTFEELAVTYATTNARLALGIALCEQGHVLWEYDQRMWIPRNRTRVFTQQPGFAHHLNLVHSPGKRVQDQGGTQGVLTGSSQWGSVEVRWDGGSTDFRTSRRLSLVETQASVGT